MKNKALFSILVTTLSLGIVQASHASLEGETIGFSNTGLTSTNTSSATVDFSSLEFTGEIDPGVGVIDYNMTFDFADDFFGNEIFVVYVDTNDSGYTGLVPDFSVTFTGIEWDGDPSKILTGLLLQYDDPGIGAAGQGITTSVSDHSFQLTFTDFYIDDEFREISYQLETGTSTPVVPVPPAAALALVGMAGVAARRWFA